MEPFAGEVGLSTLITDQRQVVELLDAVRGAKDARSTWYSLHTMCAGLLLARR
jgi:hypothetical protein